MDVISLLEKIIQTCVAIESRRALLKANRQCAHRLIDRVIRLKSSCEEIQRAASPPTEQLRGHLEVWDNLMNRVSAFIDKYNSRSGFKRLKQAGKDQNTYQELIKEIERSVGEMTLGLVVQSHTAPVGWTAEDEHAALADAAVELEGDLIDGVMSDHMRDELNTLSSLILSEQPEHHLSVVGDQIIKDHPGYCLPEDKIWCQYDQSSTLTWQQAIVRYAAQLYVSETPHLQPREYQGSMRSMIMLMQAELLTLPEANDDDFSRFLKNHLMIHKQRQKQESSFIQWDRHLLYYYAQSMLYDRGSWEKTKDVMSLYRWLRPTIIEFLSRIWPEWRSIEIDHDSIHWVIDQESLIEDPGLQEKITHQLEKMTKCESQWRVVKGHSDYQIEKSKIANAILDKAFGVWSKKKLDIPSCRTEALLFSDRLKMMGRYIKYDKELSHLPHMLQATMSYLKILKSWDNQIGLVFPRLVKTMATIMPRLVLCLGDEGRLAEQLKNYVLEELTIQNRQLISQNFHRLKRAYQQAQDIEQEGIHAQVRMNCALIEAWVKALPMNKENWLELLTPLTKIEGLSLTGMSPAAIIKVIYVLGKVAHDAVKLLSNSYVFEHAQLVFLKQQIKTQGRYDEADVREVMSLYQEGYPSWHHGSLVKVLAYLSRKNKSLEAQIVWGEKDEDKGLMYYAVQLFNATYRDAAAVAIATLNKIDFSQEIHQRKLVELRDKDVQLSQRAMLLLPSLNKAMQRTDTLAVEIQHTLESLLWGDLDQQSWDELKIRVEQWWLLSRQGIKTELPRVEDWERWSLLHMTQSLKKEQKELLEAMGLKLLIYGVDRAETVVRLLAYAEKEDVWRINHRLIYQNYASIRWRELWGHEECIEVKQPQDTALFPEALNEQITDKQLRQITDNATDKLWVLMREIDHDRGQRMYRLVYQENMEKLQAVFQESPSAVQLVTSWQRGYIKDKYVREMYKDGVFQREYHSAGQVRALGDFHIKVNPRMMGGELVSRGLEKALYNKEDTWMLGALQYKDRVPEPLWLTRTIQGRTLVEQMDTNSIDLVSYAQAVLLTVLLRSEDIKMDNVILSGDGRLHIIDNESIGCEPMRKKRMMEDQISQSEDVIVMKNCLLCMELIEETVPEELVHWFIDLDTDQVIEHWLLYLSQYDHMVRKDIPQAIIDKSHQDFTKSLKSVLWLSSTKEMQGGILRPEMPLSMISRVELGLKNMQRKVLDDPGCSLEELIELAEPSIIQVYQQVRSDHAPDIEKAFTAIENGQYNRQVIDTPDRQLMYRASVATAMQYASALGQIADKEEERILAVDAIEGCLELRKWQQFKEQYYENPHQVVLRDFKKWYEKPVTHPQVMDMMSQVVGYEKSESEQLEHVKLWSRLLSRSRMLKSIRSLTFRAFKLSILEFIKQVMKPIDTLEVLVLDGCEWRGVETWKDFLSHLSGHKKLQVLKVNMPQWQDLRAVDFSQSVTRKLMVRSVSLQGIDIERTPLKMTWPALKTVRISQFSGNYLLEDRIRALKQPRKDVFEQEGVRYIFHKKNAVELLQPDEWTVDYAKKHVRDVILKHNIPRISLMMRSADKSLRAWFFDEKITVMDIEGRQLQPMAYARWSLDSLMRRALLAAMDEETKWTFYEAEAKEPCQYYDMGSLLESWQEVEGCVGDDRIAALKAYAKHQQQMPLHFVCGATKSGEERDISQMEQWQEKIKQGLIGVIQDDQIKYMKEEDLMGELPAHQAERWREIYEDHLLGGWTWVMP